MQVEATGTSKTYVKGSLRSVFAHVSGVSEVHVDPTAGVPALLWILLSCAVTELIFLQMHVAVCTKLQCRQHYFTALASAAEGLPVALKLQNCVHDGRPVLGRY